MFKIVWQTPNYIHLVNQDASLSFEARELIVQRHEVVNIDHATKTLDIKFDPVGIQASHGSNWGGTFEKNV